MIPIVILDFETSGLNPAHDDVIEIALKVFGEDKQFTTLLHPQSNEAISHEITSITGITNGQLHKCGIPWKKAFIEMNMKMKEIKGSNKKIAIVSHNGDSFDFLFLRRIFSDLRKMGLPHIPEKDIIFIDTLPLSKRLLPGRASYRQGSLCKTLQIETEGAHRAMNDVIALEQLFGILANKVDGELQKRKKVLSEPQMIHDYINFRL